jgi:hypothetical protein
VCNPDVAKISFTGSVAVGLPELNKYDSTTRFVGQSTVFTLTGDQATGEAYCLAHHITARSTTGSDA